MAPAISALRWLFLVGVFLALSMILRSTAFVWRPPREESNHLLEPAYWSNDTSNAFNTTKNTAGKNAKDRLLPPSVRVETTPPPNPSVATPRMDIYWIRSSPLSEPPMPQGTEAMIHLRDAVEEHDVRTMLQTGQLLLPPGLAVVDEPLNVTAYTGRTRYHFSEAARLVSHLEAIGAALDAGSERVWILEEGSIVSESFWDRWNEIISLVPRDWRALQWSTDNPSVLRQGVRLEDPWVSWLPDHYGCHAYTLSREGMENILRQTRGGKGPNGSWVWAIQVPGMLLAEELVFSLAGPSYTSAHPWIRSPKTLDLLNDTDWSEPPIAQPLRTESVLVLMNTRIQDETSIGVEVRRIRFDAEALCSIHRGADRCDWIVNVVLTEESLVKAFEEASSTLPSNVQFLPSVDAKPFNKFAFLVPLIPRMKSYDLVCVKDNDQRIVGMPWATFVHKKANALLAGPLRQVPSQTLRGSFGYDRFWFNSAENWKQRLPPWSTRLFVNIGVVEVPWLEIHLVLMDGDFAEWFWTISLQPDYVSQPSNWGINNFWCPAAKEYRELHNQTKKDKASCVQVPVISVHENSRQIDKGSDKDHEEFKAAGKRAVAILKSNSTMKAWIDRERKALDIIQRSTHKTIALRCKKLTGMRKADLEACFQAALQN